MVKVIKARCNACHFNRMQSERFIRTTILTDRLQLNNY